MPRINRRSRSVVATYRPRVQTLELLLGPAGASAFRDVHHRDEVWHGMRREITPEFQELCYAGQAEHKDYAAIAEQYARQVVSGAIPAAQYVRAACQRHLDDLARYVFGPAHPSNAALPYRFDADKASRVCRYIELLPHVKGKWAARGERIHLTPWQVFSIACIFGWVHRETGLRRFTLAYLEVPRKNAKSTIAAGIGLYVTICDGEFGAEVYSGATSEKQAMEVFRPAAKMMQRSPELCHLLGVVPRGKRISVSEDGSRFEPVVRNPGDGASPHAAIVDEYHEHPDDTLFDTFRTGMGAREQPLQLVITTSGVNLAGPCKSLQQDVIKVLEGSLQGDEVFGVIYSIDEGDDWTGEAALIKANPNYGVSVEPAFLRKEQMQAIQKPRKRGIFKTKHLCVWEGANEVYFDLLAWRRLGDPSLNAESFLGDPCCIAVDLSSKKDFTARVLLFRRMREGKAHYFAFTRFYVPQSRVDAPENGHYVAWKNDGYLNATHGDTIDFERVTRETAADAKRFRAKELAHDPWNAEQLVQEVEAATGVLPVKVPQTPQFLSAPTKELDVLISEGRIHHDGNPVMAWMMGNVIAPEDRNENVFPQKQPGNEGSKIDGAIALIMAVRQISSGGAPKPSVYRERGLRVA